MKKNVMNIGIITLIGNHNYGNRLQNYATQEILNELANEVKTINIKDSSIRSISSRKFMTLKTMSFNELKTKINKSIYNLINRKAIKDRSKIFQKFTSDYITQDEYDVLDSKTINKLNEYDYFVIGSDQVWNPRYISRSQIYFLTVVPSEKKIAYAPSFGIGDIPFQFKEKYQKWLSDINKLSTRENAGAKIIKSLTNRDAIVLVDPTLMLTKEKWLSISKKSPNTTNKKYILTYFLSGMSNQDELKIKKFAKRYNLEIVNLINMKNKIAYKTGPSEFIDYINSAHVVFTDSFHGTVFSIILETPFIVFDLDYKSASTYSRIETLLDMFNFRSREIKNIKKDEDIFNINFSHVNPILKKEQKKAINYLKEAMQCM